MFMKKYTYTYVKDICVCENMYQMKIRKIKQTGGVLEIYTCLINWQFTKRYIYLFQHMLQKTYTGMLVTVTFKVEKKKEMSKYPSGHLVMIL